MGEKGNSACAQLAQNQVLVLFAFVFFLALLSLSFFCTNFVVNNIVSNLVPVDFL